VLLAVLGFVLMTALLHRRVPGAILIGMVLTALAGALGGFASAPTGVFAMPFTGDLDLGRIALRLDVPGVLRLHFLPVLLTLFLMSFFDTLGTLVGLGAGAKLLDARGDFPEIERPMLVDALSC